jgi:FKBP-type peptidyl-prolyl cis-trans isomerase
MKKDFVLGVVFCSVCLMFFSCSSSKNRISEFKSEDQKISYTIGQDMGAFLKQMGIEIDKQALYQGIEDTLYGRKSLLTPEQALEVKQEFTKRMQEIQMAKLKEISEKNKKEGEDFLNKNKKEKGVITTASGLQYIIMKEGTGPKPKATDVVTVHYKGTFIDGKEFDNSYKRGQPATFPLNGVIPGWTEGLQLMKTGTMAKLFVPANLAYGERGAGQAIEPNKTLIFEIELISVQPNTQNTPGNVDHIK